MSPPAAPAGASRTPMQAGCCRLAQ
jgi:hypothetical protein